MSGTMAVAALALAVQVIVDVFPPREEFAIEPVAGIVAEGIRALGEFRLERPPAQPDLDWLAGYWLSCENGTEVSETWSTRRGAAMLGTSLTLLADGSSTDEQMRIAFSFAVGPDWQVHFMARPVGQEPATFRLVRHGDQEAVFENPEHDFPNRIRYRREGETLFARIEGREGRSAEWTYRSAPLNERCEPFRESEAR